MRENVIPEIRKEIVYNLAREDAREDGRSLLEYRALEFETGKINTAQGSAKLKLGKTELMAGVKYQTGTPYPDKPDQGVLMTHCELKPMAHPGFHRGAPSEEAIEIARVVDRGIRESGMIDMHGLCLKEGEEVWMIFLDIQVLNYDGNLFDAATMACVLALHDSVLPDGNRPPLKGWPLTATFIKIKDRILVDPTFIEQDMADTRFTVSFDDAGDIRAMQKGLKGSLSYDDVIRVLDSARNLTSELRARLQQ